MNHLKLIRSKIVTKNQLQRKLAVWNFQQKKTVFTNGCFDILHRGHVEYLSQAASLGDVLIVGLNTDASIKRLKGETRPLQNQDARAIVLAGLQFISVVTLFDEDTPYELIKFVQPDILVKGSDYKPENIVGYDIVTAKGGEIKTIDLTPGHSTTNIITKMNK